MAYTEEISFEEMLEILEMVKKLDTPKKWVAKGFLMGMQADQSLTVKRESKESAKQADECDS
ncbi:hypothetical protein [Metasolibacillus sp.]|uniref:hypothetical protein n=1 Tax=Metasolibacillus sp. TaxID=2703680 RepID=UPI0025CE9407|nr:hypothetical protein [Metasolibacillus sp.]MCT6922774.1 hypothetical protein [Metasolibacillus sp.]MCT6938887.1 hypothetical protein [Metasolibacillus sp.]